MPFPKKPKKTRSSWSCYGAPAKLPDQGSLYTLREVLSAVAFEAEQNPGTSSTQDDYDTVEKAVRLKFLQANPRLPLITADSVIKKIIRDMDAVNLLDANKLSAKRKSNLLSRLDKIFDLVTCQCPIAECQQEHDCPGAHVLCQCPKENPKVPDIEAAWLMDQRLRDGSSKGEFIMKGIDWAVVEAQQKKAEKIAAKEKAAENRKVKEQSETGDNVLEDVVMVDIPEDDGKDTDFARKSKSKPTQNRSNLDYFIAEVVRYGYSDRGAAALYNAALKTVGLIEDGRDNLAVDKSKIRRARDSFGAKQKEKLKTQVGSTGGLLCIGADGKRNKKTKQIEVQLINNSMVEKVVTKPQEHIVYTQEPGGSYLQHSEIAPTKGTGQDLADDFLEVIIENNSEITIVAILVDGTNTNTGWRDGMIAHLERKLQPKRLLIWIVCMAHGNELPLRHLFTHCDGGHGTSGPSSFEGPLGQACCGDVHLGKVVTFVVISTTLPDLEDAEWQDLSRDQKLLYRYVKAIAGGKVPDGLVAQVAGPVNHSRWLTLSIRLMILYTRTSRPSKGLKLVVKYIVQVYSVIWFKIKRESKFTSGPSHLYTLIKLVKTQSLEVQGVVKPAIQRNAYLAHPSTMLCSMLESAEESIRCKAVKILLEARKNPPKVSKMKVLKGVRRFSIPPLNWSARNWCDIIDWETAKVHEPSILKKLDSDQLEASKSEPVIFPNFPLHSQSVERCVKLVTEASTKVVGEAKRHQHILSVVGARKIRKSCDTKKDYKYGNVD